MFGKLFPILLPLPVCPTFELNVDGLAGQRTDGSGALLTAPLRGFRAESSPYNAHQPPRQRVHAEQLELALQILQHSAGVETFGMLGPKWLLLLTWPKSRTKLSESVAQP